MKYFPNNTTSRSRTVTKLLKIGTIFNVNTMLRTVKVRNRLKQCQVPNIWKDKTGNPPQNPSKKQKQNL